MTVGTDAAETDHQKVTSIFTQVDPRCYRPHKITPFPNSLFFRTWILFRLSLTRSDATGVVIPRKSPSKN